MRIKWFSEFSQFNSLYFTSTALFEIWFIYLFFLQKQEQRILQAKLLLPLTLITNGRRRRKKWRKEKQWGIWWIVMNCIWDTHRRQWWRRETHTHTHTKTEGKEEMNDQLSLYNSNEYSIRQKERVNSHSGQLVTRLHSNIHFIFEITKLTLLSDL